MKEHRTACIKGEVERSAIAEHAWSQHHPILWEETKVIDQARRQKELIIKEALNIHLVPEEERLNRDTGLEIPACWNPIVKRHSDIITRRHHWTIHFYSIIEPSIFLYYITHHMTSSHHIYIHTRSRVIIFIPDEGQSIWLKRWKISLCFYTYLFLLYYIGWSLITCSFQNNIYWLLMLIISNHRWALRYCGSINYIWHCV